MSRKKILKQERKDKDVSIPSPFSYSPESENEGLTEIELKALDSLNILTRQHIRVMLKEYEFISYKHNRVLDIPYKKYDSCRDLKKEDISRLDLIKKGFSTIPKEKRENVNTDVKESDLQMSKKVQEIHKINIEVFTKMIRYVLTGFNKYRYDQCPNVSENKSILETGGTPNKVLQETLLSLKITNEEMISEEITEKKIRLLAFGFMQDKNLVKFTINIPEIKEHDQNKITLSSTDTGLAFCLRHPNEKLYYFDVENLANKIDRKTTSYEFKGKDSVVIRADKIQRRTWMQLFAYKNDIKDLWKEEMKEVLKTMSLRAQEQMEPLEFIWNIALIFANCKADLLNLPSDLNHVNKRFENYDEMIIYYKTMIGYNSHLKALFYILGGALYRKLLKSWTLKKPPKKKDLSKYIKETEKEIRNLVEVNSRYYAKGCRFYYRENDYEEANSYFEKASLSCLIPNVLVLKCIGLIKLERFKEAFMDSIFALRNLGLHEGYQAFLAVLKHQIESGNVILAIDMAISLKYNFEEMKEHQIQTLKIMKRKGISILNNIFKSHSLVFQKKYKDAILFLEKAEKIISIKSGYTSVILLLLYFICKNYKEVLSLGEEIILENDHSYRDIVYYLLGMSSYYMKKLSDAVSYLEKITLNGVEELTRIKSVRIFLQQADSLMKSENFKESIEFYDYAKNIVKDNDPLLAFIWKKLGVLNMLGNNFEEVIKCFTNYINICGKTKNILVTRSEAYKQLGMMNEAKKDHEEAQNISENEAEF